MLLRNSLLAAALLVLVASPAAAHDYKLGALEIGHPWARATPKGAAVASGYLTIKNTGTAADRLIGGSAAFAGHVQIHEMKMSGGVMQMRPVAGGLEIKPGQTVELKPGSFHVMFMDLKQPLQQGQMAKGTLVFEKAGSIEVEYMVEGVGGQPAGHDSQMSH